MNSTNSLTLLEEDCLRSIVCLTRRETAVMIELSDDLTNAEIAARLCITAKSVANYRNRISGKLNLNGPRVLGRFARNNKEHLKKWLALSTEHNNSSVAIDLYKVQKIR